MVGLLIVFVKVKVKGGSKKVLMYVFLDLGLNMLFCMEDFFGKFGIKGKKMFFFLIIM